MRAFIMYPFYDFRVSRYSNLSINEGYRMNRERQVLIAEVGTAVQVYQRATDGFDDAVGSLLGLNPTDLRCLDWLTSGPMTAGELATATGLSSAATTTLIDRLEDKGYVTRERDGTDRRKVAIRLTSEAETRLGELYGPLATEGGNLLELFSDDELARIRTFLQQATSLVEQHELHVRSRQR
jgi:DNA-binding MarR family transcriptional regulator